MPNVNSVNVEGNVASDPIHRSTTKGGAAVCNFAVIINHTYKSKTGETKEEAIFVPVVAWNALATAQKDTLRKGHRVAIEGRLGKDDWTAPDGSVLGRPKIVASSIKILNQSRHEGTSVAELKGIDWDSQS
jgi:single-strand DNA-binding protein